MPGADTVGDGGTPGFDYHGHGTHAAGTVGGTKFGVAKGVTLVSVRVLDGLGRGTSAGVAAGVDWITGDHDPGERAVANMSLGGFASPFLDAAVTNSIADGVVYVVAAGNNQGEDACNSSPARVPGAITVGAVDSSDTRALFSNIGACLDLFAPGVSITSAWKTTDTQSATISGTSMAAPHVAGAAALVLAQYPALTPQQVRDSLYADATLNAVSDPGLDSPNRLLYIRSPDFSVSVVPGAGTVVAGGSVSATFGTATTVGNPQPVSLSATQPPAGDRRRVQPAGRYDRRLRHGDRVDAVRHGARRLPGHPHRDWRPL